MFKQSQCVFVTAPLPYPRWNDITHIEHTHTLPPAGTMENYWMTYNPILDNIEAYLTFEFVGFGIEMAQTTKIYATSSTQFCAHPKLDEIESVLRALCKQLLQAAFLLWELVVDLPDVHTLQQGVAVAGIALIDVYKQVLVALRSGKEWTNQLLHTN